MWPGDIFKGSNSNFKVDESFQIQLSLQIHQTVLAFGGNYSLNYMGRGRILSCCKSLKSKVFVQFVTGTIEDHGNNRCDWTWHSSATLLPVVVLADEGIIKDGSIFLPYEKFKPSWVKHDLADSQSTYAFFKSGSSAIYPHSKFSTC